MEALCKETIEITGTIHRYNIIVVKNLFDNLDSQASQILAKIRRVAQETSDSIDLSERDVHVLYKFFFLSDMRSKWLRGNYWPRFA